MPSTIPYDPALALGNLVGRERLDILQQIAAAQAPADAAEDMLNAMISLQKSLDMTVQELAPMGIDTTDLDVQRVSSGRDVAAATEAYATARSKAHEDCQRLRAAMSGIRDSNESPLDYSRTQVKQMPLSADSLRTNVRYFSFDSYSQDAGAYALDISSFINDQVSCLGATFSSAATSASAAQVNREIQNLSISGTLVIAITCTHKDAVALAPMIIDVDKGIHAFNAHFPDATIKTDSPASISAIATQAGAVQEKALTILSGTTLGSCFIGMVHILDNAQTPSSDALRSIANALQSQMKVGSWFRNEADGFGFSDGIKALLSAHDVISHCTLTTIGSIPSVAANPMDRAVPALSVAGSAEPMAVSLELQDINAMMTALDDYVRQCWDGSIGTPITYYTQRITAPQLAQGWIAKYYPGKYVDTSDAPDRHKV